MTSLSMKTSKHHAAVILAMLHVVSVGLYWGSGLQVGFPSHGVGVSVQLADGRLKSFFIASGPFWGLDVF